MAEGKIEVAIEVHARGKAMAQQSQRLSFIGAKSRTSTSPQQQLLAESSLVGDGQMASSDLVPGLNWLLLIELITVILGTTFFFFFLPRFLGILLSYGLRIYLWRSLNARFEITAIQFAPLGGRIAFKDVRYFSRNQSLRVQKGHLTWRYWLWRVRDDELGSKQPRNDSRPCRFIVELEGVEWFLYNRTPSYDALVEALGSRFDRDSGSAHYKQSVDREKDTIRMDTTAKRPAPARSGGIDWLREILPVQIHAHNGSITLGNRSTKMLLITAFKEVSGTYSVVAARSKFDLYKQVFRFTFREPAAVFRTNPDHSGPMREHGERALAQLRAKAAIPAPFSETSSPSLWATFPGFLRLLQAARLDRWVAALDPLSGTAKWEGLARYRPRVESAHPSIGGSASEYAKVATLLTCPELELEYYADTVGPVPPLSQQRAQLATLEGVDVGNGDLAPQWGVDVKIKGGTVTYGPWTDRQRVELQTLFTPTAFFDAKAHQRLEPGDQRVHAALKIFIEISDTTVIRIPTREKSKDWQYDGETVTASHRSVRKYGWLDFEFGGQSNIQFILPMVIGADGFDTVLELHLGDVNIVTSVNSSAFLRATSCSVNCIMPSPLKWSDPREWLFNIKFDHVDIFLLRDHCNLIADLVTDFTDVPPVKMAQFMPTSYVFQIDLRNYNLHIYLNDRNVINNPEASEDNTWLIFRGPQISAKVNVPGDQYMPAISQVDFSVSADNVKTVLTVPTWHTHRAFATGDTETFGTVGALRFDGSYVFYAAVEPENVEKLTMSIDCRDTVFKAYVWVIQALIEVRENYFGTHTHFKTQKEYKVFGADALGDSVEASYRHGTKDVYEVKILIALHDSVVVVPEEHYGCHKALLLYAPDIAVDLRNHDWFMDMTVQVDPLDLVPTEDYVQTLRRGTVLRDVPDGGHLAIDGLEIAAHRMFGPNPANATYVCIWDFVVGRIAGRMSPIGLVHVLTAASTVIFSLKDCDNDLPAELEAKVDPDVTFLTARVSAIDLQFDVGDDLAASVQLDSGLTFSLDDLADDKYLKHIEALVPSIRLQLLATMQPNRSGCWREIAGATLDCHFLNGVSAADHEARAREQLSFIAREDESFRRIAFAYAPELKTPPRHRGILVTPSLALHLVAPTASSASQYSYGTAGSSEVEADVEQEETLSRIQRSSSAHRRSLGPSYVEGDITAGDESDTSTDADSQESVRDLGTHKFPTTMRSAAAAPPVNDDPAPYWRLLTKATRHSTGYSAHLPAFATPNGSPLVDTHAYQARTAALADKFAHFSRPAIGEFDTFAIACQRQIDVRLSPLCVRAVERIIESMPSSATLESRIDALQSNHTDFARARLATTRDAEPKTMALILEVPSISVTFLQAVLSAEQAHTLNTMAEREVPAERDLVSKVGFTISRLRVEVNNDVNDVMDGSVRAARAELSVSNADRRTPPPVSATDQLPTSQHALFLAVDGGTLVASIDGRDADVNVQSGDVALRFLESAAELVLGSVMPWLENVSRLMHVYKARTDLELRQRRRFVELLLWHGARNGIDSDPIFLIRAMPLFDDDGPESDVQLMRSDLSWKLLAHMRHALRLLPSAVQQQIAGEFENVSAHIEPGAQHRSCIDALSGWRSLDEQDTRDLLLLDGLYLDALPTPILARDYSAKGRLTCGNFSATVIDEAGSGNRGSIGPISLAACVASTYEKVELVGSMSLGRLDVRVNPELLDLVRHILHVQRVFVSRILAFQSTGETTSATATTGLDSGSMAAGGAMPRKPISADFVAVMTRASFTAEAHGVTLSLDLDGTSVASSMRAPFADDTTEPTTLTVFGGLDQVVLAIIQPKGDNDARELARIELERFRADAAVLGHGSPETWSRDPRRADATASLVVGLHRFEVQVIRSLARLHDFIEEWRAHVLYKTKPVLEELRKGIEAARTPSAVRTRTRSIMQPKSIPAALTPFGCVKMRGQLSLGLFAVRLQATSSLRVDYLLQDLLAHGSLEPAALATASHRQTTTRSRTYSHDARQLPPPTQAGVQIGSQEIEFVSTASDPSHATLPTPEALSLPTLRASARIGKDRIDVLVSLDHFTMRVTASTMDSMLAAQQRFGQEVAELTALYERVRQASTASRTQKRSGSVAPVLKPSAHSHRVLEARVALQGITIAVAGPNATQFIEARLVEARVTRATQEASPLVWHVGVSDLALSLAQGSIRKSTKAGGVPALASSDVDRRQRLAYFVLDLSAGNAELSDSELPAALPPDVTAPVAFGQKQLVHFHVRLPKVHAVMQAAAVDALGDLAIHFIHEVGTRKRERASQLTEARRQAQSVMSTVDAGSFSNSEPPASFLARCVLSVRASEIGLAVPLETPSERTSPADSQQYKITPAFLVSMPSITFATRKAHAGYAEISKLTAQFLPSFNQELPRDFDGQQHQKRNRLVFPEMTATFRPVKSAVGSVHIRARAKIKGLEMDIDPSIVSSVVALSDVFTVSQERFAALTASDAFEQLSGSKPDDRAVVAAPPHAVEPPRKKHTKLVELDFQITSGTSTLQIACADSQGAIRMMRRPKTRGAFHLPELHRSSTRARPGHHRTQSDLVVPPASSAGAEDRPDVFDIPGLSIGAAWSSGRADQDDHLHVDSTLHSSQNELPPSFVAFMTESMAEVKQSMRRSAEKAAQRAKRAKQEQTARDLRAGTLGHLPRPRHSMRRQTVSSVGSVQSVEDAAAPTVPMSSSTLGVALRLRVEKSTLKAECAPMAQVAGELTWAAGTFLVSRDAQTGGLEVSILVDQVGVGIRHSHASENNLDAAAADLKISASWTKRNGDVKPSLSIVADLPSLSGRINMRALDDWLCFRAIWIERFGAVDHLETTSKSQPDSGSTVASLTPPPPSTSHAAASVESSVAARIVAVRIQKVDFQTDFGPNIGQSIVTLNTIAARGRIVPGEDKAFSVHMGDLKVASSGKLHGEVTLSEFDFETAFRDAPARDARRQEQLLSIVMRSGTFSTVYDYNDLRVLALQLDPVLIRLHDDWSSIAANKLALLCSVRADGVKLVVCALASDAVVHVTSEIFAMLDEAQTKTDIQLRPHAHELRLHKAGSIANVAKGLGASSSPRPKASHDSLGSSSTGDSAFRQVGELSLTTGSVGIGIFSDDFYENRIFRLDLDSTSAKFVRDDERELGADPDTPVVHRSLQLAIGWLSLRAHHGLRPLSRSDVAQRHVSDFLADSPADRGSAILSIPGVIIDMQSWSASKLVRHEFSVKSQGRWDPKAKVDLWQNLFALFRTYRDRTNAALVATSLGSSQARQQAMIERDAQLDDTRYVAIDESLDPTLTSLLNSVTAGLVLGKLLNLNNAPRLIHRLVALQLDELLAFFEGVYRRELLAQSSSMRSSSGLA